MKIAVHKGRALLWIDDGVVDIQDASDGRFSSDLTALLEQWNDLVIAASSLLATARTPAPPVVELEAPVGRPHQIVAVGLNYGEHARESGFAVPELPTVFTKFASSIVGPESEVVLRSQFVDWEIELVVTIGRQATRVSEEQAWQHVAGFSIGQDLSEREVQFSGEVPQFSLSKSYGGFSPIGPLLVTPDEFDDPDDIELVCTLNGEVVQRARTSEMILSVPMLIARLSSVITLLPGDVLFTGTPAGVGFARDPAVYLKDGDVLVSEVDRIGSITQRFAAAG